MPFARQFFVFCVRVRVMHGCPASRMDILCHDTVLRRASNVAVTACRPASSCVFVSSCSSYGMQWCVVHFGVYVGAVVGVSTGLFFFLTIVTCHENFILCDLHNQNIVLSDCTRE